MVDYSTGKKLEQGAEAKAAEMKAAWKTCQTALNELGLAKPPLTVDGDPGPATLEAAKGLVPLIISETDAKEIAAAQEKTLR